MALLFQSAVAAERAGLDAEATARLRDYLARAPPGAADRAQAELRLAERAKESGSRPPAATAPGAKGPVASPGASNAAVVARPGAPAAAVTDRSGPAAAARPSRTVGWSVLAAGVAVAAVGGGVLAWAVAERADLDAALVRDEKTTKIQGIAYNDAVARAAAIRDTRVRGGVALAVGVAGAGVGVWLLSRKQPQAVSVTVAPGAVYLAIDLAQALR